MKKLLILLIIFFGMVTSCDSDNDPIMVTSINLTRDNLTLHYDETFNFTVLETPSNIPDSSYIWRSSDPDVAEISHTGVLTAKKIGQTIISIETADGLFDDGCVVTVTPYSNLCAEPITQWGIGVKGIKDSEQRVLIDKNSWMVSFYGENANLSQVRYYFNNDEDQLSEAMLLFNASLSVLLEGVTFFTERYTPLLEMDGVFYFTDNENVVIGFYIDVEYGCRAVYLPIEPEGNGFPLKSVNVGKYIEKINEIRSTMHQ